MLLVATLALGSAIGLAKAEGPEGHLASPDHVTPEMTKELRGRMGRHGKTMTNLVTAVVLLDRPVIQKWARNISDEEIVSLTWAGADSRPAKKSAKPLPLPREFYKEQDALRVAAQQLAVAALPGGDDKALADAFGTVTRTCVSCHSSYLHGELQPEAVSKAGPVQPAKKP